MPGLEDWFAILKTGETVDSYGECRTWTAADLERIADSYNSGPRTAVCTITHWGEEGQARVEELRTRRAGDETWLESRCSNVKPWFAERVRDFTYPNRSVGLLRDCNGEPAHLAHIAFLGGTPPAVEGLPPIQFSGVAEWYATGKTGKAAVPTYWAAQQKEATTLSKGDQQMDDTNQINERLRALEVQLNTALAENKSLKGEIEARDKSLENAKVQAQTSYYSALDTQVDGLVSAGRLTAPDALGVKYTLRAIGMDVLGARVEYKSADDAMVATTVSESLLSALGSGPEKFPTQPLAAVPPPIGAPQPQATGPHQSMAAYSGKDLIQAVQDLASEKKISVRDALVGLDRKLTQANLH